MSIGPFETASIVVGAAALAGYVNHLTLKLPQPIALTLTGVAASVIVLLIDLVFPAAHLSRAVAAFMDAIDFKAALLGGMLSFLLFAGALHIDLNELRRGKWLIAVLSTAGVLASTAIVGGGFWLLTQAFALAIPLPWCLVFGALISPTDPVAVIALLQPTRAPPLLKTTIAAESLFNDGIGIVVFTILLAAASSGQLINPLGGLGLFAVEAGGGAVLGLVVGVIGYFMIRTIEDYVTESLISVALVMAGYSLAFRLGVSGPVAMAVAGLIIGNFAVASAMSEITRGHLLNFWDLIDNFLNATLFLLIGLQGIALLGRWGLLVVGLACVPLVLAARAASVTPPLVVWRRLVRFRQAFPILTWGGLRGGICIAMALSLPRSPVRDVVLASTYVVVMFSVIVQGATIEGVIRRVLAPARRAAPAPAPIG